MALCNGVSIEDATIDELQVYMTHGRLTSQQLVECYLARIDQTNKYVQLTMRQIAMSIFLMIY